jgi:glutamine amidotransferase
MKLAILNYGMANLRSVQKAFEAVGHEASVITTPEEIAQSDRLVLPGVGAVGDALAHLRDLGLDVAVIEHVRKGRPFLGVCLGMQMLVDRCTEGGEHRGLGIIEGDCVRLDVDERLHLKVPHMGWNTLDVVNESPLTKDLPGDSVYFVHGYHVRPTDRSVIATTSDYGGAMVSSIAKDNVMAVQFHPEKSQAVGLKMLENFAKL